MCAGVGQEVHGEAGLQQVVAMAFNRASMHSPTWDEARGFSQPRVHGDGGRTRNKLLGIRDISSLKVQSKGCTTPGFVGLPIAYGCQTGLTITQEANPGLPCEGWASAPPQAWLGIQDTTVPSSSARRRKVPSPENGGSENLGCGLNILLESTRAEVVLDKSVRRAVLLL